MCLSWMLFWKPYSQDNLLHGVRFWLLRITNSTSDAFMETLWNFRSCNSLEEKDLPLTAVPWQVKKMNEFTYHKSWLRRMNAFPSLFLRNLPLISKETFYMHMGKKLRKQEAAAHRCSAEFPSYFEYFRKFPKDAAGGVHHKFINRHPDLVKLQFYSM